MGKSKPRPTWKMPSWMEPYRKVIEADNGGWQTAEGAMNCDGRDCNVVVNAPRALVCQRVSAHVRTVVRLHDAGLLT